MTKRKKNLIDMPTTPKFTKEMLEELELRWKVNSIHAIDAAFPSMRDELRRLWKHEEKYKQMIEHEKDGFDYIEVVQNMNSIMEQVLEVFDKQRKELEFLKKH